MLEQIVRPFQTPTTIADKAFPTSRPVSVKVEKVLVSWGAAGQAPDQGGLNVEVKKGTFNYAEKSRSTTDVRIENPDDPNQFIIAKRINSIEFTKPSVENQGIAGGAQGVDPNQSGSSGGAPTTTAYKQLNAVPPTETSNPLYSSGVSLPPPDEKHNFKLKPET
jgi:hypothetical protein